MGRAIREVALVQAHAELPVWHEYYVPDLVELCGLAAAVRPEVGEVAMPVHPNARDPLGEFERYLKRRRPELVGISVFTSGVPSALQYAELAKRHGAITVLGGYHASARPDELLGTPFVDWVVRGEGEVALAALARAGSADGVDGVSFRRNGGVVHNPLAAPIADLDALPAPWRAIRPERCGLRGLDYHTDTVYASRGCRARCVFCANHLVGGPWRERGVGRLIEELSGLPGSGRRRPKRIKFWDSAFLADADRVEQLCRAIRREGLHRSFRFFAESRVEDIVRARDVVPLMKEAGFVRIGCGVESPHARTHAALRKGLNHQHVTRAAAILSEAGIVFSKFYILGHEDEDEDTIRAYPDESLKVGVRRQHATFFVMTPYPGTESAERAEQRGIIASRDWALYMNLGAVIAPNGIPPRRLQILHAGVTVRHTAFRRFLDGHPAGACLTGFWWPLALLSLIERRRDPGRTGRQRAEDQYEALLSARGDVSRPASLARRAGLKRRLALRVHLGGRPSIWIGGRTDGQTETMTIRPGGPRVPGRLELHVDLERFVRAIDRLNARPLMNDAFTAVWNPLGFRPARLPGFARELGKVLRGASSLVWFHLRTLSAAGWRDVP